MSLNIKVTEPQAEFLSEILQKKRHSATVRAESAKARKTRRLAQDDGALAESLLIAMNEAGYQGLPSERPREEEPPETKTEGQKTLAPAAAADPHGDKF